ncbi:MAG: glycoside hydrolase [Verrucomicrobia bacterium]|jgi:alpha-glucosidase|nr:glycoside hydrolase [Verrucomicrobiota bacterium]
MQKKYKTPLVVLLFLLVTQWVVVAASSETAHPVGENIRIPLLPEEYWWGGLSVDGFHMPFGAESDIRRDLYGNNRGNQASPILVSSKGRYVWSEAPYRYTFADGVLTVDQTHDAVFFGRSGDSLQEGYRAVSQKYFPSNGEIPDPLLFTAPQYNTWIELMYNQNQEDILRYAFAILSNGYPAGVLMIDDNWQTSYGDWTFRKDRFEDPKQMITLLKEAGFKIMMWICPFMTADTQNFRYTAAEGLLHLDPQRTQDILWANTKNKAAMIRWWNGASAMLDLSNPRARTWFEAQLDHLVDEYGVDGFKFDAGDTPFYRDEQIISYDEDSIPNDHTMYFGELGLNYPLNEYRASWKMVGLPLAQRLRDKGHNWADLEQLIPGMLTQGLMGYAYTCPDMIGGGEYQSFLRQETIDEELIVRSAQVHALMPMMQFSVAPWRVLSPQNNAICRDMANLHAEFGEEILALAHRSSQTGEPIVKPLAWYWPNQGYETIQDQFILGSDLLVAPVFEQGARSRTVRFPEGIWHGDDGSKVVGPATIEIDVPLERLPYYRLQKDA